MRVYVWYEGRRLGDYHDALSVEFDGDEVKIDTSDDEIETWDEDEWDDIVILGN